MLDRHGVQVVAKVAANQDAPPDLLEDLARHKPPVQKAFREIARHRNASASALLACLTDREARNARSLPKRFASSLSINAATSLPSPVR
ncbi:hypothetical protein [Streptomyces sp. NPDC091879]|uniref:hypothetical protein n=1 Tax=Streptomyces sp. NPDC091879 TaxID=3366006 RepID=UPI00380DB6A3